MNNHNNLNKPDKSSPDKPVRGIKSELGSVFWVAAGIIFVAAVTAMLFSNTFEAFAYDIYGWLSNYFSWFLLLAVFGFCIFLLFLALSPYGRIKIGANDSKPEFSFFSWIGMLFSSGLGAGLVFFGVAEPMSHFMESPFVDGGTGTEDAARLAMGYSFFHWGISQWSVFGIAGLAIGYIQYRKNQDGLVSTALEPLFGKDYGIGSRRAIDILAVVATVTGMSTSVGLGIMQMNTGLDLSYGIPSGTLLQVVLTALMVGVFLFSTITGLKRGMKFLSNVNMILAAVLSLFVLAMGPFTFIMETIIVGIGDYINNFVSYSLRMQPYHGGSWVQDWTVFYFAWAISWSPFIGSFIARVSKGRTIREYVLGVLIVPPTLSMLWIGSLGGTALHSDLFNGTNIGEIVMEDETVALFAMFEQLPLTGLISAIAIILIFTFLVTSADSATYIISGMSTGSTHNPQTRIKIIWGILLGFITLALILSGGLTSLEAASLLAGLPFSVILILLAVSTAKSLRREPNDAMKRRQKKR